MQAVNFYYSIGSRYSYLAATQLEALEKETGCQLIWLPLNSRRLITDARAGSPAPPETGAYDWGYRQRDAERWAALYQVPFFEPRGRVDFDSQVLALAAVAANRLGAVRDYSMQLFSAMFAEPEVNEISREECIRRAEICGLSRADFEKELDSPATAAELDDTIAQARKVGAFGVPTFAVGGQLFWGNDRLPLLRHFLLNTNERTAPV